LPNKPANSSFITVLLAALVLGAAIGVGSALLLEYSHDGWHPPVDGEGLPRRRV
jgi:uncharacterized protein involved in exopolysaccharide biosynthesis